ncbi:unnamed protein product [Hyaloperonospora brassicae]|uniref:3-oxo-5-alpha-steroid 4-dehydrogenase C-terminal domain-containing protein n=1 Tax=Hyaloperonospora brassicae TaxID=162125 RepID=A0AAV0TN13_HYABA|nr:unnamed protein product [Hyaloperonospora brassicae]
MGMLVLWQLTWVLALVAALLSFRSELCRGFVLQGKTRTLARLPPLRLLHVELPKSYWTWFYLIGAIHSNGIVLAMVCWQNTRVVQCALHVAHPAPTVHEEGTGITIQPHAIAFLMLFAAHTTRRAVESVLVTEFGTAKMHASILFVGMYHYVATPLSVLFDPDATTPHSDTNGRRLLTGLGILLFVVASYHQMRCNSLLAKQKRANNMVHVVPRGDWFNVVRSPLYATEVMLYVSFVLVTGGTTAMLYLVGAWVMANQVLLAHLNSQWIENKFRDRQDELPKWNLIPFIW